MPDLEAPYNELVRLCRAHGLAPVPAEQYARRAVQEGVVHLWPNGRVSVMIDGRVDSSPSALNLLAGRLVAGAPSGERYQLNEEERRALREAKLARDGHDYAM